MMLKWLKNRRAKKNNKKAAIKKVYSDGVRIIPRSEHGIWRKNMDDSAIKFLSRLNKAGDEA